MSFLFYTNRSKGLKENPGMGNYILTCCAIKKEISFKRRILPMFRQAQHDKMLSV